MRYRLLGPVTVLGDTGEIRPGGQKQTSVLAALLLNPGRVVSEDRLIDLTWGENAPPSVRGRLQVHISELRKLLGRDVILRRAPGYLIEVAPGDRDLDLFDAAVAEARATSGADAVAHLRAALALWEGTPLGGVSEALAEHEGPALAERRLVALEELYEQELAAGRHGEVVGELRRLVDEYPFRERLRAALMLALHRCGRTPEALETYTRAHDLLVEELGIEPGQALQDLRMRILRGEGEPAPAAPAPPRPAELPLDVRGFAGRAPELAALDEPGDVWVITGTAGVGKTALAVHWAHTARARYADGQLYVNLRGFDADDEPLTPAAALAQLLRTLGVDLRDVPPGVDDQSKLYRSLLADRQALVVLDNARDTAQVLPLLPSSGRVLVTSRHRLDELVARVGARSLGLAQLREADSRALLSTLLGDRTAAEPEAAAELARLCGHHPLALRIAAANTGVASIGELVDELRGDPLAHLGFDGESAVAKAFSVSYQALAPELRQAFRLLALVPGPDFTAIAAAALLAVPAEDATRRLRGLIAANLLEAHAPRRYRFHDLARRYAEQCVRAEEDEPAREAAWERLFTGYCAAADAAVALLGARIVALPREDAPSAPSPVTFADAASAVAWLDVEVPNLSAALRQAAARGPYPGAWYLADALRRFFHDHGRRAEWLELAPIVLRAAQDHGAQPAEALVQLSVGGAYFREGQHEAGIRHTEKAVLASRACGWRQCEATAVANLGAMLEWTGRLSEAVEHSRRAIQLFRELGNRSGEALALNSLSCHYRQLGRLEQAEDCLVEAIALARKEDLAFWEAANLADLGWVLLATGRLTESGEVLDQALAAFRDLGSSFGEATALNVVSALRLASGDPTAAAETAEAALACARRDGDRQVEAAALIALGRAEESRGDLGAAERVLREARALTAESGLQGQLTEAAATLARVLAAGGRATEAGEHARTALDAARTGGFRLIEAEALLGLAAVEAAAGRSMLAAGTARESKTLYGAVGHVTGEASAAEFLARLGDRATG
ncbi:AfsR/SARP family transcriptional regulator [Amycolatopsis tolypomycina]|uniref:DNA-binding transcriptional activator of the SARP family n=1 Tax=Amycolatopsis tolypomycina TaxID=208445 RepID=A0A1H4ID95_9PSEU|nr:BTAD domain-containing putative transcriptional regulator [Amycolatopsis tolypomycina]SEB32001.1 DNA-binding transcriptional activator of the SARP family [Amycolatopsis tolypomycina]